MNQSEKRMNTISRILASAGVSEDLISQVLSKENEKEWAKAFTSPDVEPAENYETFEFLGDAITKSVFSSYIVRKFPDFVTKDTGTNLRKQFMSTKKQAELARKMGLVEHLIVPSTDFIMDKVQEDAFESFFGCLSIVGDRMKEPFGYVMCHKVLVDVLERENIDPTLYVKDAVSSLKEIDDRIGGTHWHISNYKTERDGVWWSASLYITPKVLNKEDFGYDIIKRLGNLSFKSEQFRERADAKEDVAQKALSVLDKEYGINLEFARAVKMEKDKAKSDKLRRLLEEAEEKLAYINGRDKKNYRGLIVKNVFLDENVEVWAVETAEVFGQAEKVVRLATHQGTAGDTSLRTKVLQVFIDS